jgi:hypothetical protein
MTFTVKPLFEIVGRESAGIRAVQFCPAGLVYEYVIHVMAELLIRKNKLTPLPPDVLYACQLPSYFPGMDVGAAEVDFPTVEHAARPTAKMATIKRILWRGIG